MQGVSCPCGHPNNFRKAPVSRLSLMIRFSIILSALFVGCGATGSSRLEEADLPRPRIAFVTMRIAKGSDGQNSVVLLDQQISEGKLKRVESSDGRGAKLSFDVIERDSITSKISIDHPLYKVFEFVDSTDKLGLKSVTLTEAEFFIRVPMMRPSASLRVYESLPETEKRELTTITLRQ